MESQFLEKKRYYIFIYFIYLKDEFRRSHALGFGRDVCGTSETLHSSLEPSILSIFEESSTREVRKPETTNLLRRFCL